MASVIAFQLVFFTLAVVQQQAGATRNGFMFLSFPVDTASLNSAPCLLRGQPPIRRDDYTYVPGLSGYKLHTQAISWPDARLICQEEGGYLAIINSVAESRAIAQVFQKSQPIIGSPFPDDAFIGFHDHYREGEYVTIHGESLQKAGFDQWHTGQPNNLDIQNCGGVHSNGRLNDLPCNEPFGFICEIPVSQDNVDNRGANSTQH